MAEIIGTPRDDQLTGTSVSNSPTGADDIFGLAGNDRIDGRSGDDRLFGGLGEDLLIGSLGDDLLFGEDDDDLLQGGAGADQLFGGTGRDLLLGGEGGDLLAGDAGEDGLLGGAGDDRLEGGFGDDLLFGDAGDDHLNGGPGLDRHQGGPGADRFEVTDLDAVDEVLDFAPEEGDGLDVALLLQGALDAGAALAEVVRVQVTPAGTLVALDPDGGGFHDAALLRGVALTGLTAAQLGFGPPVAVDDSASTNQSTAITLDPLANDQSGGDRLTLAGLDTTGTVGTLALAADGRTLTYTPDPTFFGIDTFRYTVANSLGETDDAEVRVGVLGAGDIVAITGSDGAGGFAIPGPRGAPPPIVAAGSAVSGAGDTNGDGLDDVIIGAPYGPAVSYQVGRSYVVFGRTDSSAVDVNTLAETGRGFTIVGFRPFGRIGYSVSGGGDINGDGLADVSVPTAFASETYVVFGSEDPRDIDAGRIAEDASGFVIREELRFPDVDSGGDINGDGLADVVIGGISPQSDSRFVGKISVVFSDPDPASTTPGFIVNGDTNISFGAVDVADDVNGDGLSDIVASSMGTAVVVFGKTDEEALDLTEIAAGRGGFVVYAGFERVPDVSTGDINGDGRSDIFLSAGEQVYVVFGQANNNSVIAEDAVRGEGGFAIRGINFSAVSLSGAGDVNGDGFDDMIVGAPYAGPAEQAYVIFGKQDASDVQISDIIHGIGGFALDSFDPIDNFGYSVDGAGDVNGDGFADLVIGAPRANPGGLGPGAAYVVFGGDFTASVDLLGSAGDDELVGTAAGEIIVGAQGDDLLIGGGGADLLNGAAGDDLLAIGDVGFRKLLGGSGSDTVRLDGAGDTLDLTAIPDPFVHEVERIDLNGDGNRLVLNALEILNLDDNSNTLTVLGDASNAVSGDLTGAAVGQTSVGGVTFASFTVGHAELLVQAAVDTSGVVV